MAPISTLPSPGRPLQVSRELPDAGPYLSTFATASAAGFLGVLYAQQVRVCAKLSAILLSCSCTRLPLSFGMQYIFFAYLLLCPVCFTVVHRVIPGLCAEPR